MEFEIGRIITYDDGKRNAIVTYASDISRALIALCDYGETKTFSYDEVKKTDIVVNAMDSILFNLKYCRHMEV